MRRHRSQDAGHDSWTPTTSSAPGKRTRSERLAPVQRRERSSAALAGDHAFYPEPSPAHDEHREPASFVDSLLAESDPGGVAGPASPVQRAAPAGTRDAATGDVHAAAAAGIGGPAGALPFTDVIQRSFGAHDISAIQAHVGGPAAAASRAMGAEAYATGNHVAFARAPDLHTAAHEAAHVVQQRAGVQLQGGVGEVGDAYEQQADAVADAVVRGESAEHLLGAVTSPTHGGPGIQRKPEGAAGELPGGVGRLTPVQVEMGKAVNKLQAAEARAERIGRGLASGGVSPDEACGVLAQLVGETFSPVMLLGIHVANVRHETAKNHADRASKNPFKRGEGSRGEARAGAHDHTMETSLDEAFKALDNIVRVSLAVMRQADATLARQSLASTIDSLSAQASPLGWTRPESLEVATARRHAREACPPGSDQERSDVCDLPDAERVGLRTEVMNEFDQVVKRFVDVCMEKKDELQRIIDEDIALGRAVGRILIEVMGAALAGVGPIAGRVAGAAVATDLPSVVARGVDAASRANMLRTMYRALEVLPVRGGKIDYPEQATIQMIAQLRRSFASVAEEIKTSLRQLDDGELRALKFALRQMTSEHLGHRLGAFVTGYTEQVQPIGTSDPTFARGERIRDYPGRAEFRSAWVSVGPGDRRLALVRHVSDAIPALRRVGEAAGDALREGIARVAPGEQAPASDRPAGRAESFHFVRWIDNPDVAPMAEPDALELTASQVQGLPRLSGAAR